MRLLSRRLSAREVAEGNWARQAAFARPSKSPAAGFAGSTLAGSTLTSRTAWNWVKAGNDRQTMSASSTARNTVVSASAAMP
jgi:hypothetical protein